MLDMHHIRLTYEADLPARSGLGTSSSFAVGMLNAFYALKGQYASKEKLAKEAIYLERVLCAEAGGWQDQIAAAFGGFNRIDFSADGYEVRPVLLSPERKRRLNGRLMMFFTGFTRFSAEIQQLNNSRNGADKLARLQEMLALVDEAEAILTDEQADLNEFGRLLDHTWKQKRGTGAAVSTDCIDALYARGIAAGALGGKLLGAGGGHLLQGGGLPVLAGSDLVHGALIVFVVGHGQNSPFSVFFSIARPRASWLSTVFWFSSSSFAISAVE